METDAVDATTPAGSRSEPRSRTVGFGLLVLGAVAVIASAAVPWYSADARTRFSGTAITGGVAQALGVAVLAGSLLMIALRTPGRRIVSVLVGIIGVAALITMPWQQPSPTEVLTELRKHSLADSYQLQPTGGNIAYALCWLVVLVGAGIVLLRAHRWPQRAGRFERAGRNATAQVDPDGEADTAAIWKAIDAGQDPTVPTSPTGRTVPQQPGGSDS